jgi:hypothetical protein
MHALHEQLQNPLTRRRDARDRTRIAAVFHSLQSCSEQYFLALRRYLDGCPERFFDKTAYEAYLGWLQRHDEAHGQELKACLSGCDAEINRALLFLREINSEEWHDRLLGTEDEYDLVRFIDKHVHPTYLRLVEAVLAPLTRPMAYFSRLDRGKSTDGLHVWSVMQELEGEPAECLIRSYRHIIRNGIAHGGITFLENEIRYRDQKGNEESFGTASVVRLCDDLLDTCNGLAAALKVFFLLSRDRGYVPPRELLVEELQAETSTPWWTIEGCLESEMAGKPQLIVYARTDSRHYAKVQWSTIQSGILAEFFAPGYDRYFLSLRSRKAWPGWAVFDGKKLRKLREAGADELSQYSGVVENDLIFYVARPSIPALFGKLDTLAKSFRINMPIAMQQVRENLGIPRIVCRNVTVHRNSWGAVLSAEVVIEGLDNETVFNVIRKHRRRIIRSAIGQARRSFRLHGAAFLPLGYAHVAVFRRDYRRRRLSGFGLGSDLVCTVRLQRIRRIKSPDIMGATVETMGKWRIAWNRAWLETNGQQSG